MNQNNKRLSVPHNFIVVKYCACFILSSNIFLVPKITAQAVIEEVTVTAQRRIQSAQDIGMSITTFSGDQLRDIGVLDTQDLSQSVPGFTHADSGFMVPIFTMRGIGFNDFSPASSSTVGIYIDQANIPLPIMTKGMIFDLQRAEILKGPQGTLYGRNTTGGLINYIPRKPTPELSYGLDVSYSRFDKLDITSYASGPITSSLGARIAFRDVRVNEGWQKSLTRPSDKLGKEKRQSGRLILEWFPVERVFVSLSSNGWRDKSDSQAPQAIALMAANQERYEQLGDLMFEERVRDHPLVDPRDKDLRLADWPPEHRFPYKKWKLNEEFIMGTLNISWYISDRYELDYLGSYQYFDSDGSQIPSAGLSVSNLEIEGFFDIQSYSHEIRLSGSIFENTFEWMVGVFVGKEKADVLQMMYTDTAAAGVAIPVGELGNVVTDVIANSARQKGNTKAVFAHSEWQTLRYLKFTSGLRYNNEVRDFEGCTRDAGDKQSDERVGMATTFNAISVARGGSGGIEEGGCITMDEKGNPGLVINQLDEKSLSARLGFDWTPIEQALFYLTYSRGYKSGGFPLILGGTSTQQFEPVVQEKVDAYEVGGKFSVFNQRMELNFATFLYDYKDKQLRSFTVDPFFGTLEAMANIPKSQVYGAEVELKATPLYGLNLGLSAAYIKTEINEFTGINAEGEEEDFEGREFNFSPAWEYTAKLDYRLPVFRDLSATVSIDVSYTGKTRSTLGEDVPLFRMNDYTLVNYRAGLRTPNERFSIAVWGRNVTNAFSVNNIMRGGGDTVVRFTGRPQTYGVTFSYHSR